MPKRVHNPAKDNLTEAVEECEQLYAALKWAAHTQGMPLVSQTHKETAVAHINRICELIGAVDET